ncbi:DNA-binding protein [Paracoccus gahaiensis]|uniref:DNA-binding protein n=1 Tax=Paracoccus gahaiensis TaxID=1706839 RepID=A0A4U0R2S3_9RHOB|nr:DNA-binding protein [Paracoccus gahaiensis]TJZ88856.1 DNA-binding protein [Paracoccus gahaiensis]
MQYTAGQAAKATGKNIATITRAIKSGKISAQKDASGAWTIDASELHRIFPLNPQDLRKPQMQSDSRPPQELNEGQTAVLQKELAALHERLAAQAEILDERSAQISDLKEDRDHWRQQATNLLADSRSINISKSKVRPRWWWPF